ncbi:hypothetical protein ERICI_00343 [Paenibacillus larvae subsp. larvae]|uniref:Transposase n=3 Tax=Paenibacillus larvae TaxID=1464 RepID=V9WCM0_9BACL|nr:hypothetical protein ERIC2_c37661 [Paenibacillus larvae subsp. larvae DSM 25430]AVF20296.1 hypothetical protein ERICI_00343 [Paenibacillus larvae subsp. larvae]ETK28773.1 hypothetical protein ERIC1_1c22430 [Paenibacillus larvae subsp. larvae DSM 25719]QHZ53690.1 hypothetical protein ERICV_04652 [Paenibacillus larvae subsp. larvae]
MACFYMQLSRYLLAYTGNQASIMRHDSKLRSLRKLVFRITKPINWQIRQACFLKQE